MAIIFNNEQQQENASWQSYLKYGERQFKKTKSVIYSQDEIGSGFYYLHSGLVKIVTLIPEGNQKILDIHGPGKLFGEQAIDQLPYFSTAIAAENSVLYFFSTEKFKELVHTFPDFLTLFVESVVQKMCTLSEDILLKAFTAEQHISYILTKVSMVCHSNQISLTQQDIANFTGLTRITVYKVLKKWKEDDLIDIQNRMIIIKEPGKLREIFE